MAAVSTGFRVVMLAVLLMMSSLGYAMAHEVRPAIADLTVNADGVTLDIGLNVEAFVAGVDLEGIEDTDLAANADEYDRLRALTPEEMAAAFRAAWPQIRDRITIEGADGRAVPTLDGLDVPPVGDVDLPRETRLLLRANALPPVRVGWAPEFGQIILRQQGPEGDAAFTGLLGGGEMSPAITIEGAASEGAVATLLRYIWVGFDHIVPKGLDHILFVLGLFFLAPRIGPLFWQVSAFTLAHTITLALGVLGLVKIAPGIVEPIIAASIVYVAVENVFARGLKPWRPALIFVFGLLHGLGFASVLDDFGLPEGQFIPALIGFNIGVEVGQIAVIAAAFLLVGWFRNKPWYRAAIAIPASCAIALVGAYWVVERTIL